MTMCVTLDPLISTVLLLCDHDNNLNCVAVLTCWWWLVTMHDNVSVFNLKNEKEERKNALQHHLSVACGADQKEESILKKEACMFSTVCTLCVLLSPSCCCMLLLLLMQLCRDVVQNLPTGNKKKAFDYFSKYFPQENKLLSPVSFIAQKQSNK